MYSYVEQETLLIPIIPQWYVLLLRTYNFEIFMMDLDVKQKMKELREFQGKNFIAA